MPKILSWMFMCLSIAHIRSTVITDSGPWSLIHFSYHAWWWFCSIKIRIYHDYLEALFVFLNNLLIWSIEFSESSLDIYEKNRCIIVHQCHCLIGVWACWHSFTSIMQPFPHRCVQRCPSRTTVSLWALARVFVCWSSSPSLPKPSLSLPLSLPLPTISISHLIARSLAPPRRPLYAQPADMSVSSFAV